MLAAAGDDHASVADLYITNRPTSLICIPVVGIEERHGHLDNGVGGTDVPEADLRRILKPVPIAERYLEIQRINPNKVKTFDQKRRIKIISANSVLPILKTPRSLWYRKKFLSSKGQRG